MRIKLPKEIKGLDEGPYKYHASQATLRYYRTNGIIRLVTPVTADTSQVL